MVTDGDVLNALEGIDVATPVAEIKVDVPLAKQGIDSLDMATLLLALESKHDRKIPPEQAAKLRTIQEIVAYLNA